LRQPILLAGGPRSGTTWVAGVLSTAQGVAWINEPDNEGHSLFALKAKLPLGRFPLVAEGDSVPRHYERLWERAFGGFRQGRYAQTVARRLHHGESAALDLWRALCDHANHRSSLKLRVESRLAKLPSIRERADQVLVKSVHAPLALEWLAARWHPRVIVTLRHPFNVIASWMELGWGGCALETNPIVRERFGRAWRLPELSAGASRLERIAWEVGLFTSALHAGVDGNEDWLAVSHETLCADPKGAFQSLFAQLDLPWSQRTEAFLKESNRPGTGYSTLRVAAEQPDRWRQRLTTDQIERIWSVLSRFPAPWVERLAPDLG
jgi:hypothetical protein